MNKFTRHRGLAISNICLCSYPCQHWVEINNKGRYMNGVEINNKGQFMNGRNIAKIIHFTHPDYLHFIQYKKYWFLKPIIAPIHYLVRGKHQWNEGEEKEFNKSVEKLARENEEYIAWIERKRKQDEQKKLEHAEWVRNNMWRSVTNI